ncbi:MULTISPECIES: hypothetical protein [unclassified Acinetobacter]|uniref:hypothetical protein n=1 Tax=unclassified Acinetobacter TaxID=196816 RepID=UPI0035B85207
MKRILFTLMVCAIFSPAWANQSLPSALYDGYWAMTEPSQGSYHVTKFIKNKDGNTIMQQYKFECLSGKKYRQNIKMTTANLTSTEKGWLMNEKNLGEWAILSITNLQANKSLDLLQTYTDKMPQFQTIFPNGLTLTYIHSPTLRPNCQ